MSADDPSGVVPARPAATVVLVRDTPAADTDVGTSASGVGVDVFLMRRTSRASFGAGMYVFPGGRVDDIDGVAAIEPYCAGLDDEQASSALGIERGGLSYWVAAVRECFEEAGVLLARARDGGPPAVEEGDRRAVHSGDLSMAELCRRHDLVLDMGAIRYVAHWVTPIGEGARRFDTRFFLAAAPDGQEGVHDDAELVHSLWIGPDEALRQVAATSMVMLPPTIAMLRTIAPCSSVEEVLAAADSAGRPPMILPRLRRDVDGRPVGVSLPGDADYDELA